MKVLVVDDTALLLKSYERLIRSMGHEVKVAADPVEAMRIIPDFEPDLIISDWDMPKMNGGEFCARLRKLGITTRLYIVSGEAREAEALECGAHGSFTKPLMKLDLDALLHEK